VRPWSARSTAPPGSRRDSESRGGALRGEQRVRRLLSRCLPGALPPGPGRELWPAQGLVGLGVALPAPSHTARNPNSVSTSLGASTPAFSVAAGKAAARSATAWVGGSARRWGRRRGRRNQTLLRRHPPEAGSRNSPSEESTTHCRGSRERHRVRAHRTPALVHRLPSGSRRSYFASSASGGRFTPCSNGAT
jgi:hypothetical protein